MSFVFSLTSTFLSGTDLSLKIAELKERLSCESVFLSNAVSIGESLELSLGDSGSGEATA